ncbi:MAG TPA: toll/interleukin-1 receptor domain-containing protein [Bryobacteraceae bacterium]|jgi:hypothetical protein
MSYVPGCRYDLFISYASENNRDGWVTQFVTELGRELSELLGIRQFNPKESIFFDQRGLAVGQSFPDQLAMAARGSAIFVPILSPGYLTSPWCNRERIEFFTQIPHGAVPASCLAPILVRPIEETGLDTLYRRAQRISFLSADEQTPLAPGSPAWTSQLLKFAGQLKNALQKLRRDCKPLFLGKAAQTDRSETLRAWCRDELERRHFRTIPESLPALDDPEGVRASLQEAGLAIHFLGGADPAALEAMEVSVAVCSGPTILYQPFATSLSPDERLWLSEFERGLQPKQGGYQRLAGKNDQELLAVVDEQIAWVGAEAPTPASREQLAVVCEEADLASVRQFGEDIRNRRPLEIVFPDFLSGCTKAMERLRRWQDYLSHSEALLFYYGLSERERLELIWQTAQQQGREVRHDWFLAPPNLDSKRQEQPSALWNIDQVIGFVERNRGTQHA